MQTYDLMYGRTPGEYEPTVKFGEYASPDFGTTVDTFQGLLQIAKEQVPMGIYAVEKADYAELRRDKCESITKLKELTRQFKAQGFKVWSNGKDKR